jgi:hypothetical protein
MARKNLSQWEQFISRSDRLLKELETLTQEVTNYCNIEEYDAIRGADVLSSKMERWEQVIKQLAPIGRKLSSKVSGDREQQREKLTQQIIRVLSSRGMEVYGQGELLIVDGIVHVEVDSETAKIKINDQTCTEITPRAVVDRVESEIALLRKLKVPPEETLKLLLKAYKRELLLRSLSLGTQVETTALLLQMAWNRQNVSFQNNPSAPNFREYSRALFRAELYELLRGGSLIIDGTRLRYASGSDTKGAVFMMVPALGRCAHVGRIWFELAKDQDNG